MSVLWVCLVKGEVMELKLQSADMSEGGRRVATSCLKTSVYVGLVCLLYLHLTFHDHNHNQYLLNPNPDLYLNQP